MDYDVPTLESFIENYVLDPNESPINWICDRDVTTAFAMAFLKDNRVTSAFDKRKEDRINGLTDDGYSCDNCGSSNGYKNSCDEFQCDNCGHSESDN